MKHCNWCDTEFFTAITYQVYCSDECRAAATKQKIAQRYLITRRQKRKGKDRKCKSCGSPLSIYNDDPLCIKCSVNPNEVLKALKQIKGNSK